MAKKKPELDQSLFDSLAVGNVSLRVPLLNNAVQIDLIRSREATGKLNVRVEGTMPIPPAGSVSIQRNDGVLLQIRRNNGNPTFKTPVANVAFIRTEQDLWEPDPDLEIENRYTFFKFANLVAMYARGKLASQSPARLF